MTEKLYTDQERCPQCDDYTVCGHPYHKLLTDSDLRARLALLLQQVAKHWPLWGHPTHGSNYCKCACGHELPTNSRQSWIEDWQQHILSFSPDLDAALAEHDAALLRTNHRIVGASPICLDCNKAGLRNCSHFDNCDWTWVYKPDAEQIASAVQVERDK